MKLIVGLGNIGISYAKTRHNLGFLMLENYVHKHDLRWQEKSRFEALCAEHDRGEQKVILIKPQTFYNNSGETVRAIKDFYKINNADILVIHDEMALPFGSIRTRLGGSDAGNNGIKSISSHVGSDYWRIRIGIKNEIQEKIDDADFVLSRFDASESAVIKKTINQEVIELIDNFLNNSLEITSFKI